MNFSIKPFLALPIAFFVGCNNSSDSASYTTETENAIAVRVFDGDKPAAMTSFRVMPNWFIADTSNAATDEEYTFTGVTDDSGWVRIENHPEGSFTLQFTKGDSAVVTQYELNAIAHTVTIDSIALDSRGSVDGWVHLPEGSDYAWVFVKGVDYAQKTDSEGHFILKDIPSGNMNIIAWIPEDSVIAGVASIKVQPADTLFVETLIAPDKMDELMDPWRYSRKITPKDLRSKWMRPMSIPTVLTLRLDSTNFDFSTAKSDGSDLRFYDDDGEPLQIEIDTWNAKIQSGIINIRVEKAADTTGQWTMKWGNQSAHVYENADVWKDLSDSLVEAINSILVLDFESDNNQNCLPGDLQSNWYLSPETILDSTIYSNNMLAVEDADKGRSGKALHIPYEAKSPDYVLVGTRIASTPRDIGHLDSVEVWIRGNGMYNIILENLDAEKNYKAQYKGEANEKWERIVVRPQDFEQDSIGYHGWDVTRNRITHFTVFAFNGSDLWVDDVKFYGINRDDLR